MWEEVVRVVGVALYVFVLGQATLINFSVYRLSHGRTTVARHPSMLAWHVHSVTVYALGMHGILAYFVAIRIGSGLPLRWTTWLLIVLGVLGNVSMLLIARTTGTRNSLSKAVEEVTGE